MKVLTNTCLRSHISAQRRRNGTIFSFGCTILETPCNYDKIHDSPYDPTKLAILFILRPEADLISNSALILETTVSFDDIVQFIDGEIIVIYVDFIFGITFCHEAPTKVGEIDREKKTNSRSCEKPSSSQVTIHITVL